MRDNLLGDIWWALGLISGSLVLLACYWVRNTYRKIVAEYRAMIQQLEDTLEKLEAAKLEARELMKEANECRQTYSPPSS
jgi:hypothetical protein